MTERFVVRTSQWWESSNWLAGDAHFKGHKLHWQAYPTNGGLWRLQVNHNGGYLEARVEKGRIRPTVRRLVRAQYGQGGTR